MHTNRVSVPLIKRPVMLLEEVFPRHLILFGEEEMWIVYECCGRKGSMCVDHSGMAVVGDVHRPHHPRIVVAVEEVDDGGCGDGDSVLFQVKRDVGDGTIQNPVEEREPSNSFISIQLPHFTIVRKGEGGECATAAEANEGDGVWRDSRMFGASPLELISCGLSLFVDDGGRVHEVCMVHGVRGSNSTMITATGLD
jgi:hypothetical protein